jgi:hypothetical protein
MTDTSKKSRIWGPLLFALAGLAGVTLGACRQDDGDVDESDASVQVRSVCAEYCSRMIECDDDRNQEKCNNDCADAMTDCQVDEQQAALDKLGVCARESCDDFLGCTINVGAQCIFGID